MNKDETRRIEDQLGLEMRCQLAAVTGGLAPDDYAQAWWDWYLNLVKSPDKQAAISQSVVDATADNLSFAMRALTGQPLSPSPGDKRFAAESWSRWPFNVIAHGYLNFTELMTKATTEVPGLTGRSADLVNFSARQGIDALSPVYNPLVNPELLELTRAQSGQNLVQGFKNWLEDVDATLHNKQRMGTENFKVGERVAVTPGKVVFRNELIELIQYRAQTPTVHAEPILIVPAWIMKYYILDLSPENSLVQYLVEKGHTVFMVSWKNPNESDRELGMDDYLNQGLLAALTAVTAIVPNVRVHSVGYCIGGTLLAIAAAVLAREGNELLASMTLFAAQTDFSEPGELSLFISPSQLSMLESVMQKAGVLSSDKMGASFALLRANDLLWTPAVNTYIKGNRDKVTDLMAWNADGTRMPWRMHSEYLQHLYLQNDLAAGRFAVNGTAVDLAAITVPMFLVGTETDHVAPWQSVYKARSLTRSSDFTFLLTSGGHNAGIICGREHPKRRYRELTWTDAHTSLPPDQWLEAATLHQGSWWSRWQEWIAAHSGPRSGASSELGDESAGYPIVGDAPGDYVRQR